MQITDYLSSYLLLNLKVGLKGLCTITLKSFNGFHESETNTLYPPAVHLIFEENYDLDSDFVKYISAQENINITEANLKLDNWLQNIKSELASGNTYLLKNIGSLTSQNQKIQFTSFESAYFNRVNFGLMPQQNIILENTAFLNIIEEEVKNSQENLHSKIELIKLEVEALSTTESIVEQIITPNLPKVQPQIITPIPPQTPKVPKQKKDWFWVIAIIIVCLTGILVCATFIYFPPFKALEVIENPLKKTDNSLTITQNKPDTTQTYELIVGENLTPLKAQKQLLNLKAAGIYGHLLTNDSNIIVQISVATFLHLDSAQAKLKQIQNKYYPKAYLKTITPTN